MKTGIKVFDAMTTRPVSVQVTDSAQECAKAMKKNRVGSVLVKKGKDVVGIMTEQDLVYKLIAKNLNPEQVTANDLMAKELITIDPGKDIYEAMMIMRNNEIRRLPVLDGTRFVGFLTMKDILKIEPQLFELIVENLNLREEGSKPINWEKGSEPGICESCGNFSYRLVESADIKQCSECRED
jgi:signal-transduction protein with cAMP-binding, CBS, and nucleotidyltransferase domain